MLDELMAQRILSRFDGSRPEQEYALSTLFAFFRKGHLALDSSSQGFELLVKELPNTDLPLLQRGLAFPFKDREGVEWVVQEGPFYAFQKQHHLEREIVSELNRLSSLPPSLAILPFPLHPTLNQEQQQAVHLALKSPVSLITGGPGTGKSFTAAALIEGCSQIQDLSIIIAAPTGKAAFHLASRFPSSLNLRSGTLHSLLGIGSQPKPLCADLILIDECSMIDAHLFSQLLKAIPIGCRLILIGDKEQLPPVEAGSIFADLIDYSSLPCTHLKHSLRTNSSHILELAQAMIAGNDEGAFSLLESQGLWIDLDKTPLLPLLLQEHRPLISSSPITALSTTAILSCMRQGPLGADAMNRALHAHALAQTPRGSYLATPLLVTANHHDIQLYNGDQGVLILKQGDPSYQLVSFPDSLNGTRTFPLSALFSYSYNYALSIHKSQGSEYEEVLIVAPAGSEVFGREVLYTAVTRAKKRVRIASTRSQLSQILNRSSRKISTMSLQLSV